jgi:hypothetical protein
MLATIIIGALFAGLFFWAVKRTIGSVKSNSCPGCSASCSASEMASCSSVSRVTLEMEPPKKK